MHSGAWLAGPDGGRGRCRGIHDPTRTPTACLHRGGDARRAHGGNRRPAAQQLPAV